MTFLLASSRSFILVSPKIIFGRFLGASHFDDLLAIGLRCLASLCHPTDVLDLFDFLEGLKGCPDGRERIFRGIDNL